MALEQAITEQCDALVAAVMARKQRLLAHVRQESQRKTAAAREQVTSWTGQIQRTTGILRFCIETLKEPSSVAFLQVSVWNGGVSRGLDGEPDLVVFVSGI